LSNFATRSKQKDRSKNEIAVYKQTGRSKNKIVHHFGGRSLLQKVNAWL